MNRSEGAARSEPGPDANDAVRDLWAAIERGDDAAACVGVAAEVARTVNEQGRNALMWAAWMRRPAFVKALIPLSDLDASDGGGRDALMWAAAGGCGASAALIIAKLPKQARERIDGGGDTAIMIAAKAGHAEAMRELAMGYFGSQAKLVEAALLEALPEVPREVLWIAADFGHPAAVAAAIEGAAPDWADEAGRGALHVAAQFGHLHQVRRLLAAGADPQARDVNNCTPLMAAAGSHRSVGDDDAMATLAALIPLSDPLCEDDQGLCALAWAAENGRLPLLKTLIAFSDDEAARRAQVAARRRGQKECAQWIHKSFGGYLHTDWNLDVPGKSLRKAARDGDLAAVERALRKQPKFEPRAQARSGEAPVASRPDKNGADALMLAAKHGRADCVAALLPFSDPSRRDAAGTTALMHAASSGSVECVQALLSASNPNARDDLGLTALSLAAKSRFDGVEVIEALLPHVVADVGDRIGRNAAFHALAAGRADKAARLVREMAPAGTTEDGRRF